MFPRLGWPEIVIIVVVILIVFGVGKLPQVGGAIGKGIRAFRKGQSGEYDEEEPAQPERKAIKKTSTGRTKHVES